MKRTLAAIGTAIAVVALPVAAHAASLSVTYDVSGTSHVARTGSDVLIKPTTLSVTVDSATSVLSGHMPIPDADTEFKVVGLLPVKATVSFIEAAPVTGILNRASVNSTASYYFKLSEVRVAGLPAFAGNYCQTKNPVIIPANTPAGERFDLTSGGRLAGTFTIGEFENCGLNTLLINLLIPGPGNTAELNVTNGRLG